MKTPPIPYRLSFRRAFTATDISGLILYIFILASGTIGNALVVKSFLQAPDQPGTRLVVGLGIVDLVSSIVVPFNNIIIIIYDVQHWPLGRVGCLMIKPWLNSPLFASAWLLVVISFERARYAVLFLFSTSM